MRRAAIRLNPARWERARRAVLRRDKNRCRRCGKARPPFEIDHIRPLSRGGAVFDLDNLQALCRGCHITKTAVENRRPKGRAVRAWLKFTNELRLPMGAQGEKKA